MKKAGAYILQLLNLMLSIGAHADEEAVPYSRYVQRVNFINLTILVLVVVYGAIFYFLGAHFHAYLMLTIFLLFMVVFFFNAFGWYAWAKMWMISLIAVCVCYFGGSFGKDSSVHYLLFVFITLPFLVFRVNQYVLLTISVACFVLVFYALEYQWLPIPVILSAEGQAVIHNSTLSLILFWITANYIYYEVSNRQVEKPIEGV